METGLAEQLFISLESNQPQVVEDVKTKFHELFNSCNPNDTWLVNGLFDYSMQTGSLRTVEILVGIREPHDTHLFNKFSESLRGAYKQQALTLLGHVVRRQPTWLFKITRHSLFKDLLKLLKVETEVIALLSALLVINVLLPMVAGLMEPHLNDLFSTFSHLATWNCGGGGKLSSAHLLHLQMALYALFLRLYAMYPCNLLSYLRHEYGQPHKLAVFSHTIKPMLDNVKMHPFLITASKDYEVNQSRWRRMEPHDVVVECAKFAIGTGEPDRTRDDDPPRTSFDFSQALESKYRRGSLGTSDKELYSPTSYCGMSTPPESAPTSIPHTPITQTHVLSSSFPQQEGTSPPEAAVEATPETTPIKDLRPVARGPPVSSGVPRALNSLSPGHSQPCSPLHKQPSPSPFRFPSATEPSAFHELRRDNIVTQKMQRIVHDRIQLTSDTGRVMNVQTPPSPLRLINPEKERERDSPAPLELDQEDREVEITMTSDSLSQNLSWQGAGRQLESAAPDDEMEECASDCARGGICMPSADNMRAFTRQVKSRLRFYSQCQDPASYTGLSPGSSPSDSVSIPVNQFRRANSCPEIKKTCLSLERHLVEKVDEEPYPLNGHSELTAGEIEKVSTATQTDNPLPYEHLFLAVFPPVDPLHSTPAPTHTHEDPGHTHTTDTANSSPLPQKTFSPTQADVYMNISGSSFSDTKKFKAVGVDELREQLQLVTLQLHFERHRREMHAERNRRLLGQSRKVRSQEELTSALKDQVALLQSDKEMLHTDLHQRVAETKAFAQQLQESVNYYQQENSALQVNYTKERNLRESLEQELKQERDKTANVTKDLNEARAQLSLAQAELCRTAAEAGEGRELRARLTALQRDLVVGGEARERYRRRLEDLAAHAHHAAEAGLADRAAQQQINALEQAVAAQTAAAEAARARIAELEVAVGRRDAAVADSKRMLQVAKHEYCEQLEAVESKYNSLRAVNSRLEGELLRLRHLAGDREREGAGSPPLPSAAAPPPPLPHPLANLQALVDLPGDADAHSQSASDHNG